MVIKIGYDTIMDIIGLMSQVTSAKMVQEDYKVINFFVKDNQLYALSTDGGLTFCMQKVDAVYDAENETSPFMVLSIRELSDMLSKFASLQMTQVKQVVLSSQANCVVATIIEEAKDIKGANNLPYYDMYNNHVSRYKMTSFTVKPLVTRELPTMVLPEGSTEIASKDLQKYLEYMYTPMNKPRETSTLCFSDDYVFAILGNVFGLAMKNELPKEIFSNIGLNLQTMGFLKNAIIKGSKLSISKEIKSGKVQQPDVPEDQWKTITSVILYVKIDDSILLKFHAFDKIHPDMAQSFKIELSNYIEVDKPYFVDVLKRIEGYGQVFLEVNIVEDENVVGQSKAECIMRTTHNVLRVPVKKAQGVGTFKFMLRPETLHLLSFSHLNRDLEGNSDKINDLMIYMDMNGPGSVALVGCDRSGDWKTRFPKAPCKDSASLSVGLE